MNELPLIYGMNKTSEAGRDIFAPSIFLFGCNLRCPFCMNGRIVIKKEEDFKNPVKTIDINSVFKYCKDNNSEWLMVSGGEPFYINSTKLENLFKEIKSKGLKIGVSTNGTYPDKLKEFICYLDYITMDFKSSSEKDYFDLDSERRTQDTPAIERMLESLSILRSYKKNNVNFAYEIRTTLYPSYISCSKDLDKIGDYINIDEMWVLQPYRHAKNMLYSDIAMNFPEYSYDECMNFLSVSTKYSKDACLRYV